MRIQSKQAKNLKKLKNLQVLVHLLNKESNSNHLQIITQKEVLKELNISPNTLKSWERKGLPRHNHLLREPEQFTTNEILSF